MSISNTHLFFCITTDCGNTAAAGTMCNECAAWSVACLGCGDMGVTVHGTPFCHTCMSVGQHPCVIQYLAKKAEETICICHEENARACPPCSRRIADIVKEDICICHEENARACPPCSRRIAKIVKEAICTCDGGDEPCDHYARYLADKAEYAIWCGVDECDDCGAPVKDGRMTCLCWADEEDLARMDRDLALHH